MGDTRFPCIRQGGRVSCPMAFQLEGHRFGPRVGLEPLSFSKHLTFSTNLMRASRSEFEVVRLGQFYWASIFPVLS